MTRIPPPPSVREYLPPFMKHGYAIMGSVSVFLSFVTLFPAVANQLARFGYAELARWLLLAIGLFLIALAGYRTWAVERCNCVARLLSVLVNEVERSIKHLDDLREKYFVSKSSSDSDHETLLYPVSNSTLPEPNEIFTYVQLEVLKFRAHLRIHLEGAAVWSSVLGAKCVAIPSMSSLGAKQGHEVLSILREYRDQLIALRDDIPNGLVSWPANTETK